MKYLMGSVVQGSADAYAEAQISTGLANNSRIAFRIRRIELYVPVLPELDCDIDLRLARKTSTSLLSIISQALILMHVITRRLTTSGLVDQENIKIFQFPRDEEVLVVEDPLYFEIDSATTGAANTAYIRIGYEQTSITETQRLGLIAASLQ